MITTEMLSKVQLLHHNRDMHFNVRPRYTLGAPGVVDRVTALEVAHDEAKLFDNALAGVYGDEEFDRASIVGVDGVATLWVEMPRAWKIYDLITTEVHDSPFVGLSAP